MFFLLWYIHTSFMVQCFLCYGIYIFLSWSNVFFVMVYTYVFHGLLFLLLLWYRIYICLVWFNVLCLLWSNVFFYGIYICLSQSQWLKDVCIYHNKKNIGPWKTYVYTITKKNIGPWKTYVYTITKKTLDHERRMYIP
jgi:hypothetical protein